MLQRAPTAESYDHYYGSGLYDARYPRPNPPTYRTARQHATTAARILDFGAGSGRYTLPLLPATTAFICACDISADACRTLQSHPAATAARHRLLITTDPQAARAAGPYDLAIALFGVLSHIETAHHRITALRELRSALTPHGLLRRLLP